MNWPIENSALFNKIYAAGKIVLCVRFVQQKLKPVLDYFILKYHSLKHKAVK